MHLEFIYRIYRGYPRTSTAIPLFVARVAGSWQIASAEKNAEHLRAGRDPCPLSLDMMSTEKASFLGENE